MRSRTPDQELRERLGLNKIKLTEDYNDWVEVILDPKLVAQAETMAKFQEEESKRLGLRDNSIDQDAEQSLIRTFNSKQFEFALQQYGGGTARVTNPGEFHDYPDVGGVNARYTFDHQDSLMILKKDQGQVPLVFGCGVSPNFYIMGWTIPDYAKQYIYRMNMNRESYSTGILNGIKDHECCAFSRQWLFPMWSLNKDLLK